MSASESDSLFLSTLRWLSSQANFPASRLPESAERLLLLASAHEANENADNAGKGSIQRRDHAKDAAMRAHAMRRSLAHYRCDNSAKV